MSPTHLRPLRRALQHLLIAAALLIALSGCWLATLPTAAPAAPDAAQPTEPPATLAPTSAPTPSTPPTATSRQATSPADQPLSTPTPAPATIGAVYGDEAGVFWVDLASGETLPLIAGAAGTSWALHGQQLALVRGRFVERLDLDTGQAALSRVPASEDLIDAQAYWTSGGERLLYVGLVEPDPASDEPELRLLLCELPAEGAGVPVEYIGAPAMVLGYDAARERLLLWAPAPEGEALQVLAVAPSSGEAELAALLEGLGEIALGPHGELAWLARDPAGYALVTAPLDEASAAVAHALPEGAYATDIVWALDGQRLAFGLHRGELYDPEVENLGLYTLDLTSGRIDGPLGESSAYARIAGWAPDGKGLVVHQRDNETAYYALVALDGAQEAAAIKGTAGLVGWARRPTLPADAATLDPWQRRFVSAAGDAAATSAAAASFVAAHLDLPLAERASRLATYYGAAGWPAGARQLLEAGDGVFVMQTPPSSIVVASIQGSQIVGQGEVLGQVRLAGGRLAVVYGGAFGGQQQWTVTLLERSDDGAWRTLWEPLGRNDWVTTAGAVAFEGEGIDRLRVTGTSLGLPSDVFFECAACPLRELAATWQLDGDAYVRASALAADAPLATVHWELTTRTPYALVYEAVRRIRAGEDATEVASTAAIEQLAAMELHDDTMRLLVSSASPEAVVFGPADAPTAWRATIRAGRVEQVVAR